MPTKDLLDKLEDILKVVGKLHEGQQAHSAQLASNEAAIQATSQKVEATKKELKEVVENKTGILEEKLETTNERVELYKNDGRNKVKGLWALLIIILSTIGTLWAYSLSTSDHTHNNTAVLAGIQATIDSEHEAIRNEIGIGTKLDTLISLTRENPNVTDEDLSTD